MAHDLNLAALAVISACVVVWGLVSSRLERWNVSAPIAFVVLGLVATHGPVALVHLNLHSSAIRSLAEVTLALVLFADASRVNVHRLRADVALPVRLLGIGLPLTIGAGAALAAGLFSGAGLWVAAAIGAIVAPTDAALGASVMEDERVPAQVRRVLNVESGLNDGIATPFVNLFLAGAATAEAVRGASSAAVAARALLGGAGIGIGVGLVGALLLIQARKHRWSEPSFRPLAVLALALFAYSSAVLADTNGFVAAFVAGMAFGAACSRAGDDEPLEFSQEAGTLMSLLVWFIFGAVMLVPGLDGATWRDVVFALLALTLVRMVPVAVSLAGAGLDRSTVAFIGWFGPRGLASVVFGLVAVDTLAPAEAKIVLAAVTVTIALSVLLHGVTASPLAVRYGQVAARLQLGRPEHLQAHPITTRSLQRVRKQLKGTAE
ncbi:MAG TPA: cation:proton antiporter [Acidimicrobiales bacterium]|jgi:NhaP-type Na+/H+ or K+/H+ antiporter|nr:cation:proton antiporter [Acidimicrobiales bacterium]